jgi:RNA polymerase sigma-70 factor (ECF subfamily)
VLFGLPPREREIVACIDVVGLGVAESAAALGVSAIAVRVGHHRALARLRRSGTLD